MALDSQNHICFFDRLADETLQCILDLVVARDSPLFIVISKSTRSRKAPYPSFLVSSTGAKDPLFLGVENNKSLHNHTPQSVHSTDWIAINGTSRRVRNLGKESFFRSKTIAMRTELPERIQRNDLQATNRMLPADQALALRYIRDVVIVNVRQCAPVPLVRLPQILTCFRSLRRCTLLFGFEELFDDAEWIAAAFALAGPVPLETRELATSIGIPRHLRLEEALGPSGNWENHRDEMEKHIYPILRVKADLLRVKEGRQAPTGA